MAKLFLDATDTSYKVSNGNTEVFGANGDQAITIDGNLTGVVLDANVERVAFTGSTTDYTYKQVGTDLEVYKGTTLVTKVGLQDDTTGTQLTFANGTVDAKFAPSATGLGLTVGGQTVSATAPAAVTIPAANIDVTTYPITSPTFSVASVAATATEGSNAVFTVTLANPATTATTVEYTLTNLTGATNADTSDETISGTGVTGVISTSTNVDGPYTGSLTFAAGATTATVTLPVSLDSLTETTEGVSLTLSNPTGGAIVNDAGKVATVSFVDAPATTFTLTSTGAGKEVQEGQTITFTVTPDRVVTADTTLVLNVQGKALGAVTSLTSAADFEATPAITFAQGDTAAKTITMKVANDTAVEGREAYSVEIIDTVKYESKGNQVTGVITDKLPLLSLSQNVATVSEGSSVTYTVTSDEAAPTGGITVPLVITGTSTSGTDYTALTTSSVTIAAGAKTGSVTLSTIADTTTDGDETVIVTLGTSANASIDTTKNTVTTTISDTSKALGTAEMTLTGATSVDEGSTVTYTVTLGSNATTALSIPYTLSGTATSGTDFTGSTGTISVAAGSNKGTLTLSTTADLATESAETVIVTLGAATGFTAVTGQGVVTTTINDTSVATAGSSFTLTTATDTVTGTGGDDTITGYSASGANATTDTLTLTDVINGGAGIDTLSVTYTATTSDATVGATITSIEKFNVRSGGANTTFTTLDASKISGLTAANLSLGTGDLTVSNLATGASVGIIGNGTLTTGALAFAYKTATDAVTVNLDGGVSQTAGVALAHSGGTAGAGIINTGSGATTATINSTGTVANVTGGIQLSASASVTGLTINAAAPLKVTDGAGTAELIGFASGAKITVAGAATNVPATSSAASKTAVDLGTLETSTVATIDAAGLTAGGITAVLNATTTISVTGGQGNDRITTGSVLTTGSVNAGAGTQDKLILGTNVSHANTSALAAKYTNFEELSVNGTFDMSLMSSLTSLELTGATNSITNMTATQAAAVSATTGIGATTLTLANSGGTSDVLTLTLGAGETTDAAASTGVLTITGFETLNLVARPGPSATVGANKLSTVTGAIVDTSLTAINLTGTAFNFTDIATTKAVAINGSALTGDGQSTAEGLTVAGSATAGSTITGSNYKDTFTVGAEGSTYNSGAGNDTFNVANTVLVADGTTDATLVGGSGTDTLTITGAGTLTDNYFTNVSGFEKLDTALTSAISYTGLGAAAKVAFPDGMTVTSGALANAATYTFGGGLYDKNVTLTLSANAALDGAGTDDNIAVTTGAGADTISVTASGWVGAAGAAGLMSITTGAGNDSITFSTGTILAVTGTVPVSITGGTGADTISATGVNAATGLTVSFVVAAGDSTVSAYDSITGFDMGDGSKLSSTLDFPSVGLTAYSATAATGFSAAELSVAVNGTTGLVTFSGTSAASASLAQKIAAVQSVVTTNGGDSALFTHGSNSYVFNNNTTADSVVELVGVAGTSLITTNATTANAIFIA